MDSKSQRQQVIDTANAMMGADKRAALAAYEKVCPTPRTHRCTERCREAHRALLSLMADSNARYSSRIWGDG